MQSNASATLRWTPITHVVIRIIGEIVLRALVYAGVFVYFQEIIRTIVLVGSLEFNIEWIAYLGELRD